MSKPRFPLPKHEMAAMTGGYSGKWSTKKHQLPYLRFAVPESHSAKANWQDNLEGSSQDWTGRVSQQIKKLKQMRTK